MAIRSEGKRGCGLRSLQAWTPRLYKTPNPSTFWPWGAPRCPLLSRSPPGVALMLWGTRWGVVPAWHRHPQETCASLPQGLCLDVLGEASLATDSARAPARFVSLHGPSQRQTQIYVWVQLSPPQGEGCQQAGTLSVLSGWVRTSEASARRPVGPQELFLTEQRDREVTCGI